LNVPLNELLKYSEELDAYQVREFVNAGISPEKANEYPIELSTWALQQVLKIKATPEDIRIYPEQLWKRGVHHLIIAKITPEIASTFPEDFNGDKIAALVNAGISAEQAKGYALKMTGSRIIELVKARISPEVANAYEKFYSFDGDIVEYVKAGISTEEATEYSNKVNGGKIYNRLDAKEIIQLIKAGIKAEDVTPYLEMKMGSGHITADDIIALLDNDVSAQTYIDYNQLKDHRDYATGKEVIEFIKLGITPERINELRESNLKAFDKYKFKGFIAFEKAGLDIQEMFDRGYKSIFDAKEIVEIESLGLGPEDVNDIDGYRSKDVIQFLKDGFRKDDIEKYSSRYGRITPAQLRSIRDDGEFGFAAKDFFSELERYPWYNRLFASTVFGIFGFLVFSALSAFGFAPITRKVSNVIKKLNTERKLRDFNLASGALILEEGDIDSEVVQRKIKSINIGSSEMIHLLKEFVKGEMSDQRKVIFGMVFDNTDDEKIAKAIISRIRFPGLFNPELLFKPRSFQKSKELLTEEYSDLINSLAFLDLEEFDDNLKTRIIDALIIAVDYVDLYGEEIESIISILNIFGPKHSERFMRATLRSNKVDYNGLMVSIKKLNYNPETLILDQLGELKDDFFIKKWLFGSEVDGKRESLLEGLINLEELSDKKRVIDLMDDLYKKDLARPDYDSFAGKIVRILSKLGEDGIEPLLDILELEKEGKLREQPISRIIEALGDTKSPNAIPILIEIYKQNSLVENKDEVLTMQLTILSSLGKIGDNSVIPFLMEEFNKVVANVINDIDSVEVKIMQEALIGLGKLGTDEARMQLFEIIQDFSKYPELRDIATLAFAQDKEETLKYLLQTDDEKYLFLENPSREIRLATALILIKTSTDKENSILLNWLDKETDLEIKEEILNAIYAPGLSTKDILKLLPYLNGPLRLGLERLYDRFNFGLALAIKGILINDNIITILSSYLQQNNLEDQAQQRVYLYIKLLIKNVDRIISLKEDLRNQEISKIIREADAKYTLFVQASSYNNKIEDYSLYIPILMMLSKGDFEEDLMDIAKELDISTEGKTYTEIVQEIDSKIPNIQIQHTGIKSFDFSSEQVEMSISKVLKLELTNMLNELFSEELTVDSKRTVESIKEVFDEVDAKVNKLDAKYLEKNGIPAGLLKQILSEKEIDSIVKALNPKALKKLKVPKKLIVAQDREAIKNYLLGKNKLVKENIKKALYKHLGLDPKVISFLIKKVMESLGSELIEKYIKGKATIEEQNQVLSSLNSIDVSFRDTIHNFILDNFELEGEEAENFRDLLMGIISKTDQWKIIVRIKSNLKEIIDKRVSAQKKVELIFKEKNILDLYQGKFCGTCFGNYPYDMARDNVFFVKLLVDGHHKGGILFTIQDNRLIMIGLDPSQSLVSSISKEKLKELIDRMMDKIYEFAHENGYELLITTQAGGLSNRNSIESYIMANYVLSSKVAIQPETYQPEYEYTIKTAFKAKPKEVKLLRATRFKKVNWEEDKDVIMDIETRSFPEEMQQDEEDLESTFAREGSVGFIIYENNIPVGYTVGAPLEYYDGEEDYMDLREVNGEEDEDFGRGNTIYRESTAVLPDFRGRGYGHKMLSEFSKRIEEKGYTKIKAHVRRSGGYSAFLQRNGAKVLEAEEDWLAGETFDYLEMGVEQTIELERVAVASLQGEEVEAPDYPVNKPSQYAELVPIEDIEEETEIILTPELVETELSETSTEETSTEETSTEETST
ncbi:GNAT family N-acetyltransferase, partial [Candidatus Woesearchaeota archaeon]|nr:GNAT family N-acetyltransferase [Candidatus Woesearchaeota archaeon]